MTNRKLAGIAAVVIACVAAPAGLAADATDVTVSAGPFAITTAPTVANFPNVTLSGSAQTVNASLDAFEVNDARGSGVGWNVTVQATQFAEHNGTTYVLSGKTLPTSSLRLPAPTVTQDGTTSTSPTIQSGAPWAIDAGSAVKIASAAADTGMGKYDFSSTSLALTVPASAYAKTYRSDLTVSLVSGP
jgi:hypothetical protein